MLIDNAPYSGNRVKRNSRKASVLRERPRIRLRAHMSRHLGIANSEVRWMIQPQRGKGIVHKVGREAQLRLKPGKYNISLTIGNFKTNKMVYVRRSRNQMQTIPFNTNLGIVKAYAQGGNKNVKWEVRNSRGQIVAKSIGQDLRQIVAAGNYNVTAEYNKMHRGRNVSVGNGGIGKARIEIPTGSAKLRAFIGDETRPLMSRARWMIYDVNGQKVSQTHKNNFRVNLAPGKYRAVIYTYTDGEYHTKDFTVRQGANSNVVIKI